MQAFAARPFSQVQRVLRIEAMSFDAARMFARSMLEPTTPPARSFSPISRRTTPSSRAF